MRKMDVNISRLQAKAIAFSLFIFSLARRDIVCLSVCLFVSWLSWSDEKRGKTHKIVVRGGKI